MMWAKLTHGAGAVVMVGALSFSVVVVNSGPAQAAGGAEWLTLVPVAAAGGGVGLESSATLAAGVCVGTAGVGCAVIGAAIVGGAMYATKDVTVPFYKGLFGVEDPPPPDRPPTDLGCVGLANGAAFSCQNGILAGQPGGPQANLISTTSPAFQYDWWYTFLKDGQTVGMNMRGGQTGGAGVSVLSGHYSILQGNSCAAVGTVGYNTCQPVGELTYHGAGPWPPSGAIPDANMQIQTTVKCVNPDGTRFSVVGTTVLGNLGKAVLPTCVGAPGALDGAHGECAEVAAGAIGGLLIDQSSNCLGAAGANTAYPNCVGVGGAHCTYTIRLDGVRCVVGGSCAQWAKLYAEDPSRIQCNFGSYVVPVAQCGMLERLYEANPDGKPWDATQQNTDGNPDTWSRPGPNGQPADQPAIDPLSPPAIAPVPLPVPEPPPVTTAETECFPTGWGIVINPTDWVLMPVKCALAWAFVPKAANLNTEPIRAELTRAGIQPSVTALTGVVGTLGGVASGCTGPHIVFDIKPSATMPAMKTDITPFAACVDPMKTIAGYTYSLISLVVIVSGTLRVIKSIAAGFGYSWSAGDGLTQSFGMGPT